MVAEIAGWRGMLRSAGLVSNLKRSLCAAGQSHICWNALDSQLDEDFRGVSPIATGTIANGEESKITLSGRGCLADYCNSSSSKKKRDGEIASRESVPINRINATPKSSGPISSSHRATWFDPAPHGDVLREWGCGCSVRRVVCGKVTYFVQNAVTVRAISHLAEALHTHRAAIRRVIESHRVGNARVFGSAARGEDSEQSDLDILVDPTPETTLFDIGAIRRELRELLGVTVDVLSPKALPDHIRAAVLAEARPV